RINRGFDRLRNFYTRTLSSTLSYRPVVLVLWAIVVALIPVFYMFSQKELAPKEDQGVVFGVVQASANNTLDQTKLFADQAYQVYKSFPETKNTFEITNAGGVCGGWWSSRGTSEPGRPSSSSSRRRRSWGRS